MLNSAQAGNAANPLLMSSTEFSQFRKTVGAAAEHSFAPLASSAAQIALKYVNFETQQPCRPQFFSVRPQSFVALELDGLDLD